MPLELHNLEEADLEAWARLFYLSFKDGAVGCVWRTPPSDATYTTFARGRGKKIIEKDPNIFAYKVIDTDLPLDDTECAKVNAGVGRQLIAVGYWGAFPKARTLEQVDADNVLPPPFPEENREARKTFMGNLWKHGRKHVTEPMMELFTLVTHPMHQRRGAGKMIVMKGIQQATELGLRCYLEGSAAGIKLYRSCGFVELEEVVTDMTPFGGKVDVHVLMERPVDVKR